MIANDYMTATIYLDIEPGDCIDYRTIIAVLRSLQEQNKLEIIFTDKEGVEL